MKLLSPLPPRSRDNDFSASDASRAITGLATSARNRRSACVIDRCTCDASPRRAGGHAARWLFQHRRERGEEGGGDKLLLLRARVMNEKRRSASASARSLYILPLRYLYRPLYGGGGGSRKSLTRGCVSRDRIRFIIQERTPPAGVRVSDQPAYTSRDTARNAVTGTRG